MAYPGFQHGGRGAVDAKGMGCGEGVFPTPLGVWGGAVHPPRKSFSILVEDTVF